MEGTEVIKVVVTYLVLCGVAQLLLLGFVGWLSGNPMPVEALPTLFISGMLSPFFASGLIILSGIDYR
jgi:hypothetical protein